MMGVGDDIYPARIFDLISWIFGWDHVFYRKSFSLGTGLIAVGRRDLVPLLHNISGDRKAKMKKVRSRIPKELHGKGLKWEKINENEWRVRVVPRVEYCQYDTEYDPWDNKYNWREEIAPELEPYANLINSNEIITLHELGFRRCENEECDNWLSPKWLKRFQICRTCLENG